MLCSVCQVDELIYVSNPPSEEALVYGEETIVEKLNDLPVEPDCTFNA